ncbi:MAG: hypothetical protein GX491_04610, partial [Chloroflexi bacterium]|nr:hypothetical protein [Chloroflexota bacterium]
MKNKPIAPFLSKALNISMILLIIASLMNTGAVKTVQASYDPTFLVRLTENQVHGYGWNLDDTVTLTINDPEGDDFTDYQTVIEADWDPLQTIVFFDLGEFKLKPGQEVSMSDESTTKTHIVRDLAVTVMDPEHDIVSGTAEPGSEVYVGEVCDKTSCTFRFVTADPSSGEWVADFSTPGDDPDKEVVVDIVPGTSGEVHQGDDDGNETMIHWRVPAPYIKASPSEDWVQAFDWPDGAELALTIDDPSNGDNVDKTATATAETAPGNPNEIIAEFNLEGFDLQPDFILEVTDETITRTLTVTNLAVTGFDLDNDTITGTGDPDQEVQVCVNGPDRCYTRYATSDGDGN